ncbi:MAG: hypothetical protein GX115_15040 [Ruminiclostridium sp.]|nr:hypothetical protein [Ruminiclostridium sp.]
MNGSHIIQKVDNDRWQQAQEFELKFARQTIESESYTDIGHPIKIDHLVLEQTFTGKYRKAFEKNSASG